MGSDILDERQWARTEGGSLVLRLIEEWNAGLTEQGDIVLSFTSIFGNDPATPPGEVSRSQFICTPQEAREIARMLLRALAFSQAGDAPDFAAFRGRIEAPALRALADDWNKARGTRRMPSWGDINPGITVPYLNFMWGFDRDRGGEFVGRLAGRVIMMTYRRNFLGATLRELHTPQAYEMAHACLSRVVAEPACVLYSGNVFRSGDTFFEGERLALPVAADDTHPAGVLGAFSDDIEALTRVSGGVELLFDISDWCKL